MKRLLLVGACAFAVLMGAGIPTPLQPDGTTIISNNAVISCATATTSQIGCVKPDGATININGAGVISSSGGSATSVTVGTTTVGGATSGNFLYDNAGLLGQAVIGSGLSFSGGTLSATGGSGTITGVTAGTGLSGGGTSGNVTVNLSTPVSSANGGTGVNNGSNTVTLGGSLTTSGAFASTFVFTASTNVTFPTSGTLDTSAARASALTSAIPSASGQLLGGSGTAGTASAVTVGSGLSLSGGTLTATGGGGTITGVTAGTGLTGGGTSGTVTVSLAALSANQLLGSLTATAPSGLSVPSCSGGSNALIWTSGTGFGCNTISGGSATSVTVGTTTVGSGTNGNLLYDNSGVLGNETPSSLTTTATSSVSARSLATRAADVFNVKDYGALGTGTPTTIGTTYGSSLSAVAAYTTATGATPFSWMNSTVYGLTFSMLTSSAQSGGVAGPVLSFSTSLSGNPSWSQSAPQFNGFWPSNQQFLVVPGMTVSGTCVPANTTVASTAAANNGAKLTLAAQGSAGTTLTFLETVGLAVGQPVSGTSIPTNTTIASLTSTTVTLSASTTSAVAAQAFIQFGEIANITLSQSTSSACSPGSAITFALSNSQVQSLTFDYLGMQSAFAAASANNGGQVIAPAGTYEINRPVWNPGITNANTYQPAIVFRGAGMYTTQISPTADFGSGACAIGENNRSGSVTGYAEWADFRLVGPGTANTVGNGVASMDGLCVGAKALVRRVSAWQMNAGLNVLEDHQIIEDSDFGNDFYGIYLAPNGQNIGNQRIAKTPTIGNAKAGIATAWNNGLVSTTLSDSDTGGNSPYSFYGEAIPYGQTGYAVTMIGYSVIQNMLGENVGNAYIYCEGNATTGCIVSNNTFIGGQPVVQLSSSSSYRLSGLAPRAVVYVNQFLYNTLVNADFSDVGANFALVSHGIFEGEFQGNSFGDQTVMMTNLSATVPAMITDNFGLTTGSSYNNTFKVNNASGEWRAIENNPATVGELLTYGTGYNYIGALAMTVGSQPLGVSIAAGASGSLIPVVERGFVSVAKTTGTGIAKGAQACVSSSTPTAVTACSASAGGNQFTIGSTVITAASGDTTASIDAQIVFVPSTATTALQGIVQPDGSTITISSGVISASSAVTTASISAAGTTQGTATSIAAQDVVVTSGSGTAYGVVLPAVTGIRYVVRNRSGVSISVYPPGSAQIENGGASAPAILPSGSDATYISYVSGQWYS